MSRLKIAIVANNIHFRGGMERYCAELATFLSADHEVHLFASIIDNVPFDRLIVHPVPTVRRPIIILFTQFYVRSTAALRGCQFDIVHTIGGITAKQNVVTAQYCQHAWGAVLNDGATKLDGITPYHQFMWRFTGFFERRAMTSRKTTAIIANSKKTADDLVHHYNCSRNKIHVIYNGVDAERFHPENEKYRDEIRKQYGFSDNDILVLFVGEYKRKGLATVIKSLSTVPDKRVKIAAFGQGDKNFYRRLAKEYQVEDRVNLEDPNRTIERIFGAADIFAFPTAYEPFGMVITEAMASGLPVITTHDAGAAEFIDNGVNGYTIDSPYNYELTGHLISQLAADKGLRQRIGAKAREAVALYDWRLVADKTLEVYKTVANQAKPSS